MTVLLESRLIERYSSTPGPPERTDSQIEKDCHDRRRQPECPVVTRASVSQGFSPKRRRENNNWQQKEDAGDFEPQDAPDAAKRPQKTSRPLTYSARSACCKLLGRSYRSTALSCGSGACARRGSLSNTLSRLHLSEPLASNATGNSNSDAQRAPDGPRSHPVYDVSSGFWCFALLPGRLMLLSNGIGIKVERFHPAARVLIIRASASGGDLDIPPA